MKKIFVLIPIITVLVVSITSISLLYNQEIKLGLGMMTSDEKPEPTHIPDPICFVTSTATSGEKEDTVASEACFPLSDFESLGCDRSALEYIYKYTNLLDEEEALVHLRNVVGLPEGVSEEEYEKCANAIYEKRKSHIKNTSEPYTTIEISFGNITATKLLPVVFSEITHNAEYMNEILVWSFELIGHNADDGRKTWDVTPKDQRIFYKITDEHGTNVIDSTRMPDNLDIPADLHLYSMDCGLFRTIDGESAHPTVFAVNKGTSTIIAKNSNKGILPISDGKYSFEFASMFETAVKLPKNAEIISQESKQCKLVQGIEGDPDRTYTDGYYTKMVFRLES